MALHVMPTTPRPRLQTPPLPPRPTPATAPQPSSHPRPTPLATGVPSQQPMSSCHQGPMLGFISVSPSPRQPRRACQSLPAAFQSRAPGTPCGSVVSFRSRGILPDATDPARRLELLICPRPTCDPPHTSLVLPVLATPGQAGCGAASPPGADAAAGSRGPGWKELAERLSRALGLKAPGMMGRGPPRLGRARAAPVSPEDPRGSPEKQQPPAAAAA